MLDFTQAKDELAILCSQAALAARYRPAQQDGKGAEDWVELHFYFPKGGGAARVLPFELPQDDPFWDEPMSRYGGVPEGWVRLARALRDGRKHRVLLRLRVSAGGRVEEAELLEDDLPRIGRKALRQDVLKAAGELSYRPAQVKGRSQGGLRRVTLHLDPGNVAEPVRLEDEPDPETQGVPGA